MIVLNLTIFFLIFMKLMFYFKVYDSFGLLSELIYGIRKRLIPFLIFLFVILGFFTILFMILGCDFGNTEMVNSTFYLFFNVFQMTNAVISNPSHTFWDNYRLLHQDSFMPNLIIWIIWVIWLLFQIMVSIVLLNFLIALITQAYEEVMSQA